MTTEDYKEIAPTLPHQPGIYKFINVNDVVLYVGKAKNLKRRLSSYFGERKDRRGKVKALTRNAVRIEFVIVETEQDALILEAGLIKKLQPRYNVALRWQKIFLYLY